MCSVWQRTVPSPPCVASTQAVVHCATLYSNTLPCMCAHFTGVGACMSGSLTTRTDDISFKKKSNNQLSSEKTEAQQSREQLNKVTTRKRARKLVAEKIMSCQSTPAHCESSGSQGREVLRCVSASDTRVASVASLGYILCVALFTLSFALLHSGDTLLLCTSKSNGFLFCEFHSENWSDR
ncbi:hypothetical protein RRG08_043971 [Elysia crispata]|uniref:Uncharacterized protein n=1 Tax=Elysia crispata TaxID=231223 RepID=A0AAE0ZYT5_9GAST|nr:hypothetical protein RRG08_043971 [Elysia crispata]